MRVPVPCRPYRGVAVRVVLGYRSVRIDSENLSSQGVQVLRCARISRIPGSDVQPLVRPELDPSSIVHSSAGNPLNQHFVLSGHAICQLVADHLVCSRDELAVGIVYVDVAVLLKVRIHCHPEHSAFCAAAMYRHQRLWHKHSVPDRPEIPSPFRKQDRSVRQPVNAPWNQQVLGHRIHHYAKLGIFLCRGGGNKRQCQNDHQHFHA